METDEEYEKMREMIMAYDYKIFCEEHRKELDTLTYGYLYPGFMSQIKPTFLIGRQRSTTEMDHLFKYSENPRCHQLIRFTDELAKNPLYRVIVAPGLYGWITLFAVALLAGRNKSRYLIAAIPALFTLAGCVLSAVNGYFRYSMPMYLCAPMLLWLCALAKPMIGRKHQRN